MAKLPFSSLQCHMILQKSFEYADLVLKKQQNKLNIFEKIDTFLQLSFKITVFI